MATTFDVIYLGIYVDIDPTEGNEIPENGTALEGVCAGSDAAPLWDNIHTLAEGTDADGDGLYDQDNASSNDTFTIDGGAEQTFDSVSRYDATITYGDGSTDTLTVILFQDTAGRVYLMPQKSDNADQAVLEGGPIKSITLDTYAGSYWAGTFHDFEPASFAAPACFAEGTLIRLARGERPVDLLRIGDMVMTADHGPQRLRWIGRQPLDFRENSVTAAEKDKPILVSAGALGPDQPCRDLVVSPQHRLMCSGPSIEGAFGCRDVLVPAKALLDHPGIRCMKGRRRVTYHALLFDRHEVIFAQGAPVESFRPGPVALAGLSVMDRMAIAALYPSSSGHDLGPPARKLLQRREARQQYDAMKLALRRGALRAEATT